MRESPGDTIAAISTAAGSGAIAIVRISGERALDVADAIFEGVSLTDSPSHRVHYGRIVDADGHIIDEVMAAVLRAPKTYTTEDMVEFGCHGGAVPAREVLAAATAAGARPARRGEFTERAFLGGRIDLVQAEAVADIVAARTRKGLEVALGQLGGGLSEELGELRETLLTFRAEVESLVDLVDEDVEPPTLREIASLGRRSIAQIDAMLERCRLGAAVREGVSVAIVGRPNVGKSSTMNALLARDRVIVTPRPGTTRDAIEDIVEVDGVALRLVDTAGWRDASDEAERAGVDRAREAAVGADLVLLVIDASEGVLPEDEAIVAALDRDEIIVAGNKSDLGWALDASENGTAGPSGTPGGVTRLSALTGEGVDDLRARLVRSAVACDPSEGVAVTNVRHVESLSRCRSAVGRAVSGIEDGGEPELVAIDIAEAAEALGTVTGETTPEDVLERIFARFCIGK